MHHSVAAAAITRRTITLSQYSVPAHGSAPPPHRSPATAAAVAAAARMQLGATLDGLHRPDAR